MNIYCFTMNIYDDMKIKRTVYEVEKKPKTYTVLNPRYHSRINKSEIGIITGYLGNTVYLLEDDFERARELFLEKLKAKIEYENAKIRAANKNIDILENNISEIENMESTESEG